MQLVKTPRSGRSWVRSGMRLDLPASAPPGCHRGRCSEHPTVGDKACASSGRGQVAWRGAEEKNFKTVSQNALFFRICR
jgi:hypothetical protein